MQLTGNTILITGGATGIGLALAAAFIERGNTVLVCARSRGHLDEAARQLPSLVCYACDISDGEQRQAMYQAMAQAGLSPNILVNNAAIMTEYDLAGLADGDMQMIKRDLAVNLVAQIEMVDELLPVISTRPRPAIINFNSPAGIIPVARVPFYSASKAAFHSYTQSLRYQLAARGIAVIEVFPPGVETPMTAATGREQISPETFVKKLVRKLEKTTDEIWIGEARAVRLLAKIPGRWLFRLINKQLPISGG